MSDRPSQPDPERALQRTVEEERLRMQTELAAANARTPGEWFDIFMNVSHKMLLDAAQIEIDAKRQTEGFVQKCESLFQERSIYHKQVRARLEEHGLPLTDELEIEGPLVEHDVLGMPHNVSWPRGAWLELHWPENTSEMLRFEGTAAMVALEFIQWWDGFHQVGMRMAGKDPSGKARVVDPRSPEYQRYIAGKKEALG